MQIICSTCKGRGHGDGDMMFFVCPRCEGTGYEQSAQHSVHPTAFGVWWRERVGNWLVSLGNRIIQSGGR